MIATKTDIRTFIESALALPGGSYASSIPPFGHDNALEITTAQSAATHSDSGIKFIATDHVVGCLAIIARNGATGAIGIAHIMVNHHAASLQEEKHDLFEPMIDALRADERDPLDFKIFGGLYPIQLELTGACFMQGVLEMINQTSNATLSMADIGSKPHPVGVVVDTATGALAATGALVADYDAAIDYSQYGVGRKFDLGNTAKAADDPLDMGFVHHLAKQPQRRTASLVAGAKDQPTTSPA